MQGNAAKSLHRAGALAHASAAPLLLTVHGSRFEGVGESISPSGRSGSESGYSVWKCRAEEQMTCLNEEGGLEKAF